MNGSNTEPLIAQPTRWILVSAAFAVTCFVGVHGQGAGSGPWIGTWSTALVARPVMPPSTDSSASVHVHDRTLRQVVRSSIGGKRIRVIFSNAFGTEPLQIGGASIALRERDATIVPASSRALRFSGQRSAAILPRALLVSDPVNLDVPSGSELAIDVYLRGNTAAGESPVSFHLTSLTTNYLSTSGDHTGVTELPIAATTPSWFFIARVEVVSSARGGAIVTVGDSITDGARASNTNVRWPDVLAQRVRDQSGRPPMGVLGAGIGGNRLLSDVANSPSTLSRFDRDVLGQAGVTHVIVLQGITDIMAARSGPSPSAADLIAGYRQLIARAHAKGLKIIGGTLTPFEGSAAFTTEGEAKRQAVNAWIRTAREYDALIDFDAFVRDSSQPSKLRAEYHCGDFLHPSELGYRTMASGIDLAIFSGKF